MIDERKSDCPAVICPSVLSCYSKYCCADGGSEPVIVLDEFVDEFVQAALENLLDLGCFRSRARTVRACRCAGPWRP